jgi:hemerythrin-like domain-containing protein
MSRTLEATTTEQVDVYREVHKGLRLALFEFVRLVGSLDPTDPAEIEALTRLFGDIDMMLQIHHAHEDGELRALIATHAGAMIQAVDDYHEHSDQLLAELRSHVAGLSSGRQDASLYASATGFVAGYLDHMQVEEQQVMPALQATVSPQELVAVQATIRASLAPADMCVFLRYMLPAMTPDERIGTLAGMKAGAPPEIFEMFWAVAEDSLPPSALATVEERIAT